jgi:pyruvate formate lyase activating enzyme
MLNEILFFEGNHETIILPENLSKVKIFYSELYKLFESKGYKHRNINTNSENQLKETISPETHYLVGHSQGATRILEQFSPEIYPQIKGIILFDPEQYVEEKWNSLTISRILFVNTQEKWHNYSNFQDKIEIDDNHYFNHSLRKIILILDKFLCRKQKIKMKIAGIQKTTLIDYPEKIACTIFLHGCNFKCGFCHNPELVLYKPEKIYSEKEILEFLEKRKNQLEGICICGGEPLLSLDLEFLKKIKELGYLIKIDTNGSFPEKLREIINENLVDFVAMDIKSGRENYEKIINVKVNLNKIEESIKLISLLDNYEFRTTIIEGFHDLKEVKKIAIWLNEVTKKKPKRFCLQGFKNQGKFINEKFKNKKDTSEEFLGKLKEEIEDYFEDVVVRV